jgi:DNA-directed RNA polymerase specialized sigma24 family protein
MRNLGRYDATRPLTAYLYGTARNMTRRRVRREGRLVPLDRNAETAQGSSPADFAEHLDRRWR